MKKLIILICVTAISTGISAQSETRERDVNDQQEELDQNYHDELESAQVELQDGYIYKNGRMMTIKDGMTSVMKKETRLDNGTVLAINGDYTVKGGKPTKLNADQHIDLEGVITNYVTPRVGKKG